MIHTQHDVSSSLITSMLTAGVALLPDYLLTYGAKVVSVFILAVAAEVGRRLVGKLWKKKD